MKTKVLAVFGSAVVQRLSILLMTVLATRMMGAVEFGKFALVYATCTSLSGFVADGLAATANKFVATANDETPPTGVTVGGEIASFAMCIASFLALTLMVLAPLANAALGAGTDLTNLLRLSGLIVFCLLMNTVLSALLNTFHRNITAAYIALFGALALLGCALAGASSHGAVGLCIGFAAGSCLTTIVYVIALYKQRYQFLQLSHARAFFASRRFGEFTLPTIATMALGGPVHWLCLSFLASSENGLRNVALFTALFQWYSILTFIPAALMNFTIPWLSRAAAHDARRFHYSAAAVLAANVLLSGALVACVWVSRDRILAMYGVDFAGETTLLWSMAACGFLASLIAVMNQIAWARGRSWSNLFSAAVYAGTYVGAALMMIKGFAMGALGLTGAILVASVAQGAVQGRAFFHQDKEHV